MKKTTALAVKTGKKLAMAACKAIEMKSTVSAVARQPVVSVRRAIRKGRYAAEDFAEEMVHAVRKQPLKALGIAFGVGLVAGRIRR